MEELERILLGNSHVNQYQDAYKNCRMMSNYNAHMKDEWDREKKEEMLLE